MLTQVITYTDFDGNVRTETFYFNLMMSEVALMQNSIEGGLDKKLNKIAETQSNVGVAELFKNIILESYGEKSPDGKRFIKSKELSEAFAQTEAFSSLFMSFLEDPNKGAAFIRGIMPESLRNQVNSVANNVVPITEK